MGKPSKSKDEPAEQTKTDAYCRYKDEKGISKNVRSRKECGNLEGCQYVKGKGGGCKLMKTSAQTKEYCKYKDGTGKNKNVRGKSECRKLGGCSYDNIKKTCITSNI